MKLRRAGAPGRPPLVQLRPGVREHEDRRVARRVEQVLDEVEQRVVGPLHVLERHDHRVRVGQALEEEPPGREEVVALVADAFLEAEQVREPRLDEAAVRLVGERLRDDLLQLGARRRGLFLLEDAGAHAHHVRERPVRDALAVGEAAAAVPVRQLCDSVEVLVELPGETRLADAGDARDGDQVRAPAALAVVEEVLDQPQLAVPADERRLEALRLQRAARAGDDAQRAPGRNEAGLALQLVQPRVLVDDRRLGRAARRLADEHLARLRDPLDPRRGVDDVAGDHALALGSDRHRRLAGEDGRPRAQAARPGLVAERRDRGDEVERGTHGAFRVVLGRRRRAPHRHHGVADELLDGAAVERDQAPARVEVAGEQLARRLRVAAPRRRR